MKTVLAIDDNPSNLQIIISSIKSYYKIIPFRNGKEALEYLDGNNSCDLILLDILMPDFNGFEIIKALKNNDRLKNLPVIFLTGKIEAGSEIAGLELGAADYIYKPFNPRLLRKRIDMNIALSEYKNNLETLVENKTRTIEKLSEVTISTIVSIIGTRDLETCGHTERTGEYVVALANELKNSGLYLNELTNENIYMLKKSAPLHDVGKIGIDDAILRKAGKFTDEEFEIMKTHTIIGAEAFKKARALMNEPSFLDYAEILSLYHHEKWDGSGYPCGLKGAQIPLFARIMAIADVYDALISPRPYKNALPHSEAVKAIENAKGTHFAPDVCEAFLRIQNKFYEISQLFVQG